MATADVVNVGTEPLIQMTEDGVGCVVMRGIHERRATKMDPHLDETEIESEPIPVGPIGVLGAQAAATELLFPI